MFSRPEIGTRPHIKLWCGDQDPDEKFHWDSSLDCACGKYCRQHIGADYRWLQNPNTPEGINELNRIAQHIPSKTYGELHKTLCEAGW